MNLEFGYWYFYKILSKQFCDNVIKHALKMKKQAAVIGDKNERKIDKKYRNSNITWLEDQWIYDEIYPYIYTANRSAGWNFNWNCSEKIQFTMYSKKQHYDWHRDSFIKPDEDGRIRKLSVTIQLNDDSQFDGGELQFAFDNDKPTEKRKITICKEAGLGSIIVFPSHTWHRVTPVTRGTRYSLVMWNKGYPFV